MKLTPTTQKFILHWGEMGTQWGINRTVAQVHALLYISAVPMDAETISKTLQIARSNASNSLRELISWDLIRVVNHLGDRRDYYEAEKDVYRIFLTVAEGRKKREIDPTVNVLENCVREFEISGNDQDYAKEKLNELHQFIVTMNGVYDKLHKLPMKKLLQMVKFVSKSSRNKK